MLIDISKVIAAPKTALIRVMKVGALFVEFSYVYICKECQLIVNPRGRDNSSDGLCVSDRVPWPPPKFGSPKSKQAAFIWKTKAFVLFCARLHIIRWAMPSNRCLFFASYFVLGFFFFHLWTHTSTRPEIALSFAATRDTTDHHFYIITRLINIYIIIFIGRSLWRTITPHHASFFNLDII